MVMLLQGIRATRTTEKSLLVYHLFNPLVNWWNNGGDKYKLDTTMAALTDLEHPHIGHIAQVFFFNATTWNHVRITPLTAHNVLPSGS